MYSMDMYFTPFYLLFIDDLLCHILLIQTPVNGHLDCFLIWTDINNVAMNISLGADIVLFLLERYLGCNGRII